MSHSLLRTLKKAFRRVVPGKHRNRPSSFMRVAYRVPRQAVLITARHGDATNVWPMDWHVPLSLEPELYGLAVNRTGYGAELVRASGAFVVNFVPATWEDTIFFCGRTSGREVDKLAATGLKTEDAASVNVPRLADALGWLECEVEQVVETGDHLFFVGRVTRAVERDDAPRLHHLDRGLSDIAETFEA